MHNTTHGTEAIAQGGIAMAKHADEHIDEISSHLEEMFSSADSDGDGVIDAEELSKLSAEMRAELLEMDTDGDGRITTEELHAAMEKHSSSSRQTETETSDTVTREHMMSTETHDDTNDSYESSGMMTRRSDERSTMVGNSDYQLRARASELETVSGARAGSSATGQKKHFGGGHALETCEENTEKGERQKAEANIRKMRQQYESLLSQLDTEDKGKP